MQSESCGATVLTSATSYLASSSMRKTKVYVFFLNSNNNSQMTKIKVAYQGKPGAYSHMACLKAFPNCLTVSCETFEEVFEKSMIFLRNHGRINDFFKNSQKNQWFG